MSNIEYFIKGWLIGLAIAAPVGPIGVLCIRRTLADGRLIGFLSGLGAATADMLYGIAAALGLTAIQIYFLQQQVWLRFIGGIFLVVLGVRAFFSQPPLKSSDISDRISGLVAYTSTLGLTLTNPLTILSFTLVFASLRINNIQDNFFAGGLVVVGVFLGSASWWLLLTEGVGLLRQRFNPNLQLWINRIAGVIIFSFGISALLPV
jgi:threonine/homoserine/homoserine lactone efflux protein